MQEIKLVMVGNSGIGKTSLLITHSHGHCPSPDELPMAMDNFNMSATVDGKAINLAYWDAQKGRGDSDVYDKLRTQAYPNTDVVLVGFSVVDRNSFKNVSAKWISEVNHHCPTTPIVLVGTKTDLREDMATLDRLESTHTKAISTEEGEELSKLWKTSNVVGYVECSSRTLIGVKEVFEAAVRAVIGTKPKDKKNGENCLIM